MRYYLDTEFDENADRVCLISLALHAEDRRELYLVSTEVNPDACNPWVKQHVLPQLHAFPVDGSGPLEWFHLRIEDFLAQDPSPTFWGYYSAYDWFLFCRLWGGMLMMPKKFPNVCMDLKQLADTLLPETRFKDVVPPASPAHNALADARWNETLFNFIVDEADRQAERDDHHKRSPRGLAFRRGVDAFISDARRGSLRDHR